VIKLVINNNDWLETNYWRLSTLLHRRRTYVCGNKVHVVRFIGTRILRTRRFEIKKKFTKQNKVRVVLKSVRKLK